MYANVNLSMKKQTIYPEPWLKNIWDYYTSKINYFVYCKGYLNWMRCTKTNLLLAYLLLCPHNFYWKVCVCVCVCVLFYPISSKVINTEELPGDLSDRGLVQTDRRCEVWFRGVNRHIGHVFVIACPALLNLTKRQNQILRTEMDEKCYVKNIYCRFFHGCLFNKPVFKTCR